MLLEPWISQMRVTGLWLGRQVFVLSACYILHNGIQPAGQAEPEVQPTSVCMQELLEFFWEQHPWRGEARLSQGRNWTTVLLQLRLHIQSYRDFWTSDGPSEWFWIEAEKLDFCTPALLHPLHLQEECNFGWGSQSFEHSGPKVYSAVSHRQPISQQVEGAVT